MFRLPQNFRTLKIFSTSVAIWWGVILTLPYDTFATSSAYSAMSEIAPDYVWGIFMLIMGLSHLVGILFSFRRIEQISFLMATFVWIFIAAMFGIGNPLNTASGTYALIGILTGLLFTLEKVGEKSYGR